MMGLEESNNKGRDNKIHRISAKVIHIDRKHDKRGRSLFISHDHSLFLRIYNGEIKSIGQ